MDAKGELYNILSKLGDQKADTELLGPGTIAVTTVLNSRRVIESVQDNFVGDPDSVRFVKKMIPVDFFIDLSELKSTVREDIRPVIQDNLYRVDVFVHRGNADNNLIRNEVVELIRGRVNEDHPQLIVRVDIFESKAVIGLLKGSDIFSR